MFKKVLSFILAAVMLTACLAIGAGASGDAALKFGDDGKFTIINICDIQDVYPASKTTITFINEVLEQYKPDLVILGGDNTVCLEESKEQAIAELVKPFVDHKTYFTLVFGNHDYQQGWTNDELLPLYQRFGGKYCLAYDEVPALHGTGTHCLEVASSAGDKTAFALYLFDSGNYVYDENGNELGYDCVTTDQINWYKAKAAQLKTDNGATVPAMAFQHIIVGEIYDELFFECPFSLGAIGRDFNGKHYSFLPKVGNIKTGYLFEFPCPGYYNHGQFDAFVETGDVIATISGHDHVNSYTVTRDGIDIVNTPGCTFHSYGMAVNRGCRLIVLDEKNPRTYETSIITVSDMLLEDGSQLEQQGEISKAGSVFSIIGRAFLDVFMMIFGA